MYNIKFNKMPIEKTYHNDYLDKYIEERKPGHMGLGDSYAEYAARRRKHSISAWEQEALERRNRLAAGDLSDLFDL